MSGCVGPGSGLVSERCQLGRHLARQWGCEAGLTGHTGRLRDEKDDGAGKRVGRRDGLGTSVLSAHEQVLHDVARYQHP